MACMCVSLIIVTCSDLKLPNATEVVPSNPHWPYISTVLPITPDVGLNVDVVKNNGTGIIVIV